MQIDAVRSARHTETRGRFQKRNKSHKRKLTFVTFVTLPHPQARPVGTDGTNGNFHLFHNGHGHTHPTAAAQPGQSAALAVNRAESIPFTHSPLAIPLIYLPLPIPIFCPLECGECRTNLRNRMIRTVQTEVRSILQPISEPVERTINF